MELKALSRLGWSVTALAREYGLSRTTVYKELASSDSRSYGRAKPTELNEAQRSHLRLLRPAEVKTLRFASRPDPVSRPRPTGPSSGSSRSASRWSS